MSIHIIPTIPASVEHHGLAHIRTCLRVQPTIVERTATYTAVSVPCRGGVETWYIAKDGGVFGVKPE
jgi:hypothetical protein